MNSKAALAKYLLSGRVVNIKNGFTLFGITNIPREIGRSVERSFGVVVTRVQMDGKSRYGQSCVWVNYRLEKNENNKDGILKMMDYVNKHWNEKTNPKTHKEEKQVTETAELNKWFAGYQNETPKQNYVQPTLL